MKKGDSENCPLFYKGGWLNRSSARGGDGDTCIFRRANFDRNPTIGQITDIGALYGYTGAECDCAKHVIPPQENNFFNNTQCVVNENLQNVVICSNCFIL